MRRRFVARVWPEDEWYVAQCLDVDVASQGHTEQEALDNLADALSLYFSPPHPGTLPTLHTVEAEVSTLAPPTVS
jgi:predicted RNase H-like HicB family nuclease